MDKKKITIIGTGAYGTALANALADSHHEVIMYGIDETQVDDINMFHKNSAFFGDIKINEHIRATLDLASALENPEYLVLGVPTIALGSTLNNIKQYLKTDVILINTAKGIDEQNLDLLSKMVQTAFKDNPFIKGYTGLYGPSVASEIVGRKPTIVNVASDDEQIVKDVCDLFHTEYFFAKPSDDLVGCEISAALKNVIAILAGMMFELKLGDNAHSTLLTIGLNEMKKVASTFGAKETTFLNFACLGDLILTASSQKSRNFTFGRKVVEFGASSVAKENYNFTVEGVLASKIAYEICQARAIDSQLFKIAYEIIWEDKNPILLSEIIFNY